MSQSRLLLNLGHVLVAAAWADGELSEEELTSLKDLLFSLPGLGPGEWQELERRADIPVGAQERERLVESLRQSIETDDDKELVLSALDDLLQLDEGFGPAEREALAAIRRAIEDKQVNLWDQLSGWVAGPLQRRLAAASIALRPQGRAVELHERIFHEVDARLENDGSMPALDDDELRRLCLAGGLMAQVAHVDSQVTDDEWDAMANALVEHWELTPTAARAMVEVAVVHGDGSLDVHRAMREFFELTTERERIGFLDILFDVAAADGRVTHEEMEEIRILSLGLKMSHVQFIAAKTRVPRGLRAH